MTAGNQRTSPHPCLMSNIDLRVPALTSSPGLRLRGRRLTLAASYRLAASLAPTDREMIVALTAVLNGADGHSAGAAGNDFELAARYCLSGLYLRMILGRSVVVVLDPRSDHTPDDGSAVSLVRLRLAHVRAVSSTEVEYFFRPTLFCIQGGRSCTTVPRVDSRPVVRLVKVAPDSGSAATLWGIGSGAETQIDDLKTIELPPDRGGLMATVAEKADNRLESVEPDLLGLDEWRFQEGLRVAFNLTRVSSGRGAGVGSVGGAH
ncbi:MAG: hypothetical protein JXA57_03340 [Armatimonadetes bacterium]|nr:hypothetical protein [Armatimonadota bacterium]